MKTVENVEVDQAAEFAILVRSQYQHQRAL